MAIQRPDRDDPQVSERLAQAFEGLAMVLEVAQALPPAEGYLTTQYCVVRLLVLGLRFAARLLRRTSR